jgi:hypothetical protein
MPATSSPPGDPVQLCGQVCVLGGGAADSVRWTSSLQNPAQLATTATATVTTLARGVHTLTFTATRGTASDSATTTVIIDEAPSITIDAPADRAVVDQDAVSFLATANDPDVGDMLSFSWVDSMTGEFSTLEDPTTRALLPGKIGRAHV